MTSKVGQPVHLYDLLFSEAYDRHAAEQWFRENIGILFQSMACYFIFLVVAKKYLKERKPFYLRVPLTSWNIALSVFSTIGFFKMLPAFYRSYQKHGLAASYSTFTEIHAGACGYWMLLWRLSKIPEYMDTVFLVLRKREVTFLHVYHHLTSSFLVFIVWEPFCEWNGIINYFIHAIMYAYFAMSALGIRPHPHFSYFITSIQLFQFIASEVIYLHYAYLALTSSAVTINLIPWLLTVVLLGGQLYQWLKFFHVEYYKEGGRKYSMYSMYKYSVAAAKKSQ